MGNVQSPKRVVEVGDPIPDISLTATDGSIIHLRDYRRKRLFVFMWASW